MKKTLFTFITLALIFTGISAHSAEIPPTPEWIALEAEGTVVRFEGLDSEGIAALISNAQRLVADPEAGTAVAELLPGAFGLLETLPAVDVRSPASEVLFSETASLAYPDFREESVRGIHSRYLSKMPSHRRAVPGESEIPVSQRRDERAEETCLYESFEELPIWWEEGGPWYHYQWGSDNNVGDYFWLDSDCDANLGSWMAHATWGGDYGQYLSCSDYYDYSTDSWMKYAYWIECAAYQDGASLEFAMKIQSETDYDNFGYYASLDDLDYWGYIYSGNFSSVWYLVVQDLSAWYGLGNLTNYGEGFSLAFNFYADEEIESGFGAWIDDIAIKINELQIDYVLKRGSPFRLKVYGSNFVPGAWIYIDGYPVPKVKYKHSGLVVAKKGRALKNMCPKGVPVCIQVINPGGGTSPCIEYTR